MPRTAGPISRSATVKASVVFLLLLFFAYLYRTGLHQAPDPRLNAAFAKAGSTGSYAQEDRTEAVVGDKRLVIRGSYLVDRPKNAYLSLSTTTVYVGGSHTGQSFTLANISVGNDVFSKMEVGGSAPETSIPSSESWRHFKSNDIPAEYIGIAIPGPLLDSLRLFGEGGTYLRLDHTMGDEDLSGQAVARYRFRLSDKTPPSPGGTLEALIGHIATGTVDAWIAPDGTIEQIAIVSAGYAATTSLSRFGEDLGITAPTGQ
jgi:hypothetical protein